MNLYIRQLPLHKSAISSIATVAMNGFKLACCAAIVVLTGSCERNLQPVEVRESRPLTDADRDTSFVAVMPAEWRQVPTTQFRDFNCMFGKDGEVYVSIGSGGVKENAERWLRQLGDENPKVEQEKLEQVEMFGGRGYIVEARGDFAGMQGATMKDAALLGALVESRGALVTVKMVGRADEVAAERERFLKFCKQLSWRDAGDE